MCFAPFSFSEHGYHTHTAARFLNTTLCNQGTISRQLELEKRSRGVGVGCRFYRADLRLGRDGDFVVQRSGVAPRVFTSSGYDSVRSDPSLARLRRSLSRLVR